MKGLLICDMDEVYEAILHEVEASRYNESAYHPIIHLTEDPNTCVHINLKKIVPDTMGNGSYYLVHVINDITMQNCDLIDVDDDMDTLDAAIRDVVRDTIISINGEITMEQYLEVYGYQSEEHWGIDMIRFDGSRRIIIVEKDARMPDTQSRWAWKVCGNNPQYFSSGNTTVKYLMKYMEEQRTGIRVIPRAKRAVPALCGINGRSCRHPGRCNTALCSECPVAEKFFAKRDGLKLVYVSTVPEPWDTEENE